MDYQFSNSPEKWRRVGKVASVHGLKGELYIRIFSGDLSWVDQLQSLVLQRLNGDASFHQVQSLRPFKEGLLVFLEGLEDRTAAETHKGAFVHVQQKLFITNDSDDEFYLLEIEGFQVFDKGTPVGKIVGFSSNSIQDLIVVDLGGVGSFTCDIPLVEAFISEIKFEAGEIHMDLPPGFVETLQSPNRQEK